MSASGKSKGNPVAQAGIVAALVAGMVGLFRLTGEGSLLDQPRAAPGTMALVAFGFVVLASFTIGRFVERIKLPHITGYLIAGMLFGQSIPHLIGHWLASPLLSGVARAFGNEWAQAVETYGTVLEDGFLFSDGEGGGTLGSLGVIKTLAVALIAMTAGGELKLESLRKGFRAIAAVLLGQSAMLFLLITSAVVFFGGGMLRELPEGANPTQVALAIGLVVSAISLATSPAATIAVINETRSDGPVTRTVLATVVLKDVVVVVAFSVAATFASSALGIADDVKLGPYLLTHIGGSLVVGAVLGGLIAVYLRFVGRELLLMIVAVVYAATLFADEFHLDPVLVFLATGFTASNFSSEGDTLIHGVERLSTPVYVVFFTLAGAELHLDQLLKVFPWTIGLVTLRALSVYTGIWAGSKLIGVDEGIRKHSWLGFLSQAGVAIVLSELVGAKLGATGREVQTVVISAVAINELFGPMLLQTGLRRSGEAGKKGALEPISQPPKAPEPEEEPTAGRLSQLPPAAIPPWPRPPERPPKHAAPEFHSERLTKEVGDLVSQLEAISLGVAKGPFRRVHLATEAYFRSLRREFLRSHRRVSVRLRSNSEESGSDRDTLARILHGEQAQLVRRWRGEVLGRATAVQSAEWSPDQLVETLDKIVESCPEWLQVPYEAQSFQSGQDQRVLRAVRRGLLRVRRAVAGLFGVELKRRIPFRALARYHFYGATPARLETLATLLSKAEMHLLSRSRELFEEVISTYERSIGGDTAKLDSESPTTGRSSTALDDAELRVIRDRVEGMLNTALDEVAFIARSQSDLLASIFAGATQELADDLRVAGTIDLAARTRRSSKVFHDRFRALSVLSDDLRKVRHSIGGSYRLLAMELELLDLEAQIRDVLEEQGSALGRGIRGRAFTQASRVNAALSELLESTQSAIEGEQKSGEHLAAALKELVAPLRKVTDEAVEATTHLYEQLSDDNTLAPLLDLLRKATGSLSESYEVPSAALVFPDSGRLPNPSNVVEVPFRNLVSGHFEGSIAPNLAHVTRMVAGDLHPLVTALQELSRLIDLKFDLAIAELDAALDEPIDSEIKSVVRELVVTGFQRNQELLENHVAAAGGWGDSVYAGLRKHTLEGLTSLRNKLVRGELSQLRIDVMRRKAARRRFLRRAEELPSRLEQARVLLRSSLVAVVGEERLDSWWLRLGLPQREHPTPSFADFPAPTPKTDLPLVYRRLFSAEALDLRSIREPELARARRALAAGQQSLRTAVFVGPEGVGKGAMLQAVVRTTGFKSVRRIQPDRPVTTQDVQGWFAETHPGQLVVLSGFHWMLSMEPGGFEPLRAFVDGVLRDRGQAAFAMSADEAVWNMARQVLPLDSLFGEVVHLEPLSPDELESVIMGRHRLSGSGVNFERATPRSSLEELLVRGAGHIRRPYESFFRSLHESSGGLVREAFQLWLASIQGMGRDFVRIGTVPSAPKRALRRLSDETLLELVQVARQGWTQPSAFASLYRSPVDQAQAKLARLSGLGLLVSEQPGIYTIAPHLRGVVFRVLREREWI